MLQVSLLCFSTQGQTPEVAFLASIAQDLGKKSDIILPPGTVTNILSTVLSVSSGMPPEKGSASSGNVANIVLDVSEKLMSTLIEPTTTENRKLVTTPTMEINLQIIGPAWNTTKIPVLNAKGNTMTLDNLASIAEQNNGSAAAVLMSVSGMEKLMSPSFFKSENATEMYSDIVTATLPKTKHKELTEPVNFTMYHKKTLQAGLVTCVYWMENGNETHWSVEGCTASFSNETHTVCTCTHLSTFAVLLQTGGQDNEEDDPLLEMVDLFCMCVGLAFLALAILTFLLCTWNPKVNNTARLHLCICLFLGHLLFLVGVSRTENAVVCAVIAGLLQFIFLAGFVWMLLETVQLFLLVRSLTKVQVIQKEGLKTLYLLLIGYGAPTVVVGVSAAVFPGGYGSKNT
ncbi:adhesion G protein-coupled receptor E3-like [Anguilla rostrata]|uniref:adhesion G protein-coupled receptor E3-like n=1 Tax=Anguilla rostrata TaxID=7938 RepID=UPI0030CD5F01